MIAVEERPEIFSSVKGQTFILKNLKNQSKRDTFFQVMIFAGKYGTGKTTMARIVEKAANCNHKDAEGNPCMKCESCLSIMNGTNPDVLEIDGASNNGVDAVRKLINEINFAPTGKYRVIIIDECHKLTPSAWDALLKTLEEPPAHVIFILCTTDVKALPDTIRSRAPKYDFKALETDILVEHGREIAQKRNIDIDNDSLFMLASYADGSMRNMLQLLEQVSVQCDKIEVGIVEELLGVNSYHVILYFLEQLLKGNNTNVLNICQDIMNEGKSPSLFLKDLNKAAVQLVLVKTGIQIKTGNPEYEKLLSSLANYFDVKKLQQAVDIIRKKSDKLHYGADCYELFGIVVSISLELQNIVNGNMLLEVATDSGKNNIARKNVETLDKEVIGDFSKTELVDEDDLSEVELLEDDDLSDDDLSEVELLDDDLSDDDSSEIELLDDELSDDDDSLEVELLEDDDLSDDDLPEAELLDDDLSDDDSLEAELLEDDDLSDDDDLLEVELLEDDDLSDDDDLLEVELLEDDDLSDDDDLLEVELLEDDELSDDDDLLEVELLEDDELSDDYLLEVELLEDDDLCDTEELPGVEIGDDEMSEEDFEDSDETDNSKAMLLRKLLASGVKKMQESMARQKEAKKADKENGKAEMQVKEDEESGEAAMEELKYYRSRIPELDECLLQCTINVSDDNILIGCPNEPFYKFVSYYIQESTYLTAVYEP